MHTPSPQSGFTLIELSIVLVIIGLLAGGILTGQTLIRAAEIRSVYTEKEKFELAMNAFRLKYNCIAGDCADATAYFGTDPEGCAIGATPKTQTCNGNGNGIFDGMESYLVWQHLSAAGFVPGLFRGNQLSGLSIDSSTWQQLKISPRHFWYPITVHAGEVLLANGNISNKFTMTSLPASMAEMSTGDYLFDGILTPQEMFAFDKKYDDSKPAMGNIHSLQESDFNIPLSRNCTDQPGAGPQQVADPSSLSYNFITSPTEKVCKVVFVNLSF